MMRRRTVLQLVALAVGMRAAAALLKALADRRRNRFDGLDSVVSFSSRMIAASRAVETREGEQALIHDPLAEVLAGARALERSLSRAKDAPAGRGRTKQVGLMGIRTRWFDDQILAALGVAVSLAVPAALRALPTPAPAEGQQAEQGGDPPAAVASQKEASDGGAGPQGDAAPQQQAPPAAEAGLGSQTGQSEGRYVVEAAGAAPRQVVLLGAGMDTRPWRLALPAGVRWFEVDRQDVLAAKRELLAANGARLDHEGTSSGGGGGGSASAAGGGSAGSKGDGSGAAVAHPLRAASWHGVSCDLCAPDWTKDLQSAGHDPSQPTLWVAEGLLMYLTPAEVEALLAEMAGASAPGSQLVAVSVTDTVIGDIQRRGSGSELLGTWKFGCPPNPQEFLAAHGWRQELALTRGQMASLLGIDPALCAFSMDNGDAAAARSVFFVASVAADE